MGLVKATIDNIGNSDDQWKEVIRCEEMTNDVIMVKRRTQNGAIDNGTTIVVKPGQCAAIFKNGKIIDATAEAGTYEYDDSVMPTFKKGKFDKDFRKMWGEFSNGNYDVQDECILYFNLNEIIDNKFYTSSPIQLKNSNQNLTNCYGKYSLKLSNPAVFMNRISGKSDVYRKGRVTENIKYDVANVFKSVLGELDNKQSINELSDKEKQIRQLMKEKMLDDSIREKGFKVVSFNIENANFKKNQNNSTKTIVEPIKTNNVPDSVEILQKQIGSENSFKNPITDLNSEELNSILNYKTNDNQFNQLNSELDNNSDDFIDLGFKYEEKANLVTDQLENLFADEDEINNSGDELQSNIEIVENNEEEYNNIENNNFTENQENNYSTDFAENNEEEIKRIDDELMKYSNVNNNKNNETENINDNENIKIENSILDNIDVPQINNEYMEHEIEHIDNGIEEQEKNEIETINAEISEIENNEEEKIEQDKNNDGFEEQKNNEEIVFNDAEVNEEEKIEYKDHENNLEKENNDRNNRDEILDSIFGEEKTNGEKTNNEDIISQLNEFENLDNSNIINEQPIEKLPINEQQIDESTNNTEGSVMVKMCLRCGTMNPKGTKTCINCGNDL